MQVTDFQYNTEFLISNTYLLTTPLFLPFKIKKNTNSGISNPNNTCAQAFDASLNELEAFG